MLTETTAELAAALTLSAARRVVEADDFMRAGKYEGWLPSLYVPFLCSNPFVLFSSAGSPFDHSTTSLHSFDCTLRILHVS